MDTRAHASMIQINPAEEVLPQLQLSDQLPGSDQIVPFRFTGKSGSTSLDPVLRLIPRRDPYDPLTQMTGTGPIFSAQVLDQAGLAAGFGWLIGSKEEVNRVVNDGVVLEVKGSIAGGQVALGKRERIWAVFFPLDYTLKAAYLMNWNGLRIAGNLQDRNYFGMEADFDLFFSRLSFALYRNTQDSSFDDLRSWVGIVSWGFSDS
jgi:hypothetical protein